MIDIPIPLIAALRAARHVVLFTGAGVSAESGIPTFRDALTVLWQRFDAEELATPEAFQKDKDLVWGWYEWRRMRVLRAQPNAAHRAIAWLAQQVPQLAVVTQNVDDLHERAGSVDVVHLHGSLHAPRCFACGRPHALEQDLLDQPEGGQRLAPPRCTHCGGFVRPGVVWFGEDLPARALNRAFTAAAACDLLIAIGTSGLVQPAAQIPLLAQQAGACVVQVNPADTHSAVSWTWSLAGTAGSLLPRLMDRAFPPN